MAEDKTHHPPEEKKVVVEVKKTDDSTPPPPDHSERKHVIEEVKKSFTHGMAQGIGRFADEVIIGVIGSLATLLWQRIMGRRRPMEPEVVEQARKLVAEGKAAEAGELIVKSHTFGFGYGDEVGFLAALGSATQFLYESGEPEKANALVDTLAEFDEDTLRRLRLSLAQIESVEKTAKILIQIAQISNPEERLARITKIAGVKLDPANDPSTVLVNELGAAFNAVGTGYREQVDNKKEQIRARQADRAQRLAAARERIAREGR
jgi:hypothetical protein